MHGTPGTRHLWRTLSDQPLDPERGVGIAAGLRAVGSIRHLMVRASTGTGAAADVRRSLLKPRR